MAETSGEEGLSWLSRQAKKEISAEVLEKIAKNADDYTKYSDELMEIMGLYEDRADYIIEYVNKNGDEGVEVICERFKSGKNANLLDELASSGVKYNANDVVAITKTADEKLVWLEKGNSRAGLEHIMQHADQFTTKGISSDKIPDFIMHAIQNGKIVGTQRTSPIYEVVYEGKLQRVGISISENGFIVGANPKSIP